MKTLFTVLLLCIPIWGQAWITVVTKDGWEYSYNPVPTEEYGVAKSTHLINPLNGFSIIYKFSYDCHSKSVKVIEASYRDPQNKEIGQDKLNGDWLVPKPMTTLGQALPLWCKNVY